MKKIFIIIVLVILFGCTINNDIPKIEKLEIQRVVSGKLNIINELEYENVMKIFYNQYIFITDKNIDISKENALDSILEITYAIDGEITSILVGENGYGYLCENEEKKLIKFDEEVYGNLVEYLKL